MTKKLYRAGAIISTFSLLATQFVGLAGATATGTAGNDTTGADSNNKVSIDVEQGTYVGQYNSGMVVNEITLNANTGRNKANKNTGEGDVTTGDVSTGVGISNSLNRNVADIDNCGGCDLDLNVSNMKTGADSRNGAEINVAKTSRIDQTNTANIVNNVKQNLNTGDNMANKNTGIGDVSTGDVESYSVVANQANENVANTGTGSGTAVLTATNDTTGADSKNKVEVNVALTNWMVQNNRANVVNNALINANTGRNEANKNTGEGSVKTGDVGTGIGFDTSTNSNFLAFDGCCDVELGGENLKTGADSKNLSETNLVSQNTVFQNNCGGDFHLGILMDRPWQHGPCGVVNLVNGNLNTGDNSTNRNTSDGVDSGDVEVAVEVATQENQNTIGNPVWDVPGVEVGDLSGSSWWMLFFGISA